MKKNNIDAYIITSADPHISEYVPDHYKCLQFASGFTGSAGTIVITYDFAGLWTDFRYFIQATEQLTGSGYELVKLKIQHEPEFIFWLLNKLNNGAIVACDQKLLSVSLAQLMIKEFEGQNIKFQNFDFLSKIWDDRLPLPDNPAFLIGPQFSGETTKSKITRTRAALNVYKADTVLISSLDDIAWLLNIRGSDVKFNPVVLSFVLLDQNKTSLFINKDKLFPADKLLLENEGIEVFAYDEINQALAKMPANQTVFIDPKRNCYALCKMLPPTVRIVYNINPTTHFKAIKNTTEIENMRVSMIKDGVALTRFFKWMEENVGKVKMTELSASKQLENFRSGMECFAGMSFNSISGYNAHAALPHYIPDEETASEILPEGLFLIDSGGQYHYGTTDVTRTMALGKNTDDERRDYTLVLKSMIEGSATKYVKGTRGYQIDAICRKPLWEHGIDYGHGTGHGVGFYLNVHEGPQTLNPTSVEIALEPGMITSIEPGIYRSGKYGIRIENLVLTVKHSVNEFNEFYAFETLTLALIDTTLIKKELLGRHHIDWLNNYHKTVYKKLSPFLTPEESQWLHNKTYSI